MSRALTPSHKQAMTAGRERFAREKRARSVARVAAFREWLAAGSITRDIPPIPSDGDWAIAERAD